MLTTLVHIVLILIHTKKIIYLLCFLELLYIFQYSYTTYLSHIISYYFENKRIDVYDTYCIQYIYRICAS